MSNTLTRPSAKWRAARREQLVLDNQLDTALITTTTVSLVQYEVLHAVIDGPLRMKDVALAAVLSPSGLTRVVDALVRPNRPLVRRVSSDEDRRGVFLEITAAGRREHAAATSVLNRALSELVTS